MPLLAASGASAGAWVVSGAVELSVVGSALDAELEVVVVCGSSCAAAGDAGASPAPCAVWSEAGGCAAVVTTLGLELASADSGEAAGGSEVVSVFTSGGGVDSLTAGAISGPAEVVGLAEEAAPVSTGSTDSLAEAGVSVAPELVDSAVAGETVTAPPVGAASASLGASAAVVVVGGAAGGVVFASGIALVSVLSAADDVLTSGSAEFALTT